MSKLIKNITYNIIGQIFLLILGFIAIKYVFGQLGEDALGIIYFTLTINVVLCAVLQMGISSTIVREISAHFKDDSKYIHDLIRTASLFYWCVYILIGIAIYYMSPLIITHWINLKTMDKSTAILALRIMGISSLIALPRSLYIAIFRGLQRMELNNIIDVSIGIVQQFGSIMILSHGGGMISIAYWIAGCFILSILCYIIVSSYFFPLNALLPRFSYIVIAKNIKYSLKMVSVSILSMIHSQLDKIVISKLLPIGMLGYYGFAFGTVFKGTVVARAVSQAVFPSFSILFKKGNRKDLLLRYWKLQNFLCFGTVPIFTIIPFIELPLFTYIFNKEIAQMLFLPITLLCGGFYINGTLAVPYAISPAIGKPEIIMWSNLLALFVTLPATILLTYLFGLNGAATSWILYNLFAYVYAIPKICLECLEISVWIWYLHILKIFTLIGLTYLPAWAALKLINIYSIVSIGLFYSGASVLFLVGSFFLMGEELRGVFFQFFQLLRERSAEA